MSLATAPTPETTSKWGHAMCFQPTKHVISTEKITSFLVIFALVAIAAPPVTIAQGQNPFTPLSGSWSGSGVVETSSGNERLRCRATYDVASMNLELTLRCASDSYNFNLNSRWRYDAGQVSGTWSETGRGLLGTLSGHAKGNQILVTAQGIGFSANLQVVTSGSNQTIQIRGTGSEIRAVQITLRR